jgi:hypothetical protein
MECDYVYLHWMLHDIAQRRTASHGIARHRTAWHGIARHRTASHGMARHRTASHGIARHRTAWHGLARHGTASHGIARHRTASHGIARPKFIFCVNRPSCTHRSLVSSKDKDRFSAQTEKIIVCSGDAETKSRKNFLGNEEIKSKIKKTKMALKRLSRGINCLQKQNVQDGSCHSKEARLQLHAFVKYITYGAAVFSMEVLTCGFKCT